jgi:glycosyltransferase involved in cell wall biosynthesis
LKLSVIVIFHNMRREAARTLFTLSPPYQRGVSGLNYEVIAIDNGSDDPLNEAEVRAFGPQFRYHYLQTQSRSPVEAVNVGADMARGDAIAVIVDGARMVTPGLIQRSVQALGVAETPFISALSWHLGPDIQPNTLQHGYNQTVEDALLGSINWREDGYRLFDISTLAPSSRPGFLGDMPSECSWFCMPRKDFHDIGKFDARFQTPGGGFCNQEFRNRAVSVVGVVPVALLGEGLFHQFHGGAATNSPPDRRPHKGFAAEYEAIFARPLHRAPTPKTVYFGTLDSHSRRFVNPDADTAAEPGQSQSRRL